MPSTARARPVAGSQVAVHDCNGRPLWQGTTDREGRIAHRGESKGGRQTAARTTSVIVVGA